MKKPTAKRTPASTSTGKLGKDASSQRIKGGLFIGGGLVNLLGFVLICDMILVVGELVLWCIWG